MLVIVEIFFAIFLCAMLAVIAGVCIWGIVAMVKALIDIIRGVW